ncbi:unnamed protein product [Sphagnum troendelagicum]|uniref:Uncharacterized protein n=1 Tax=Sphagnum troendelagicum TaxID=128251 RepID=A0ABP0V5L4_9BRYO
MIKETMTMAMSTDQIASRQTSFLMARSQILSSPNNKHTFRDCVKTNVLSHGVLADPFFSQKQIYLLRYNNDNIIFL